MKPQKYYVVWHGRKTGIFTSWEECEKQIKGFSGGSYKSFKTRQEAEEAFELTKQLSLLPIEERKQQKKTSETKLENVPELIIDSICVDASCIGNPGDVEYRGIYTATGEVLFHKSPMSNGTNNIGEFLAIVHGLAYLKKQNQNIPIYSDSETAIIWVKKKKVKTTLKQDSSNQEIFTLLNRALEWLKNNDYSNPVLKWNTASWGEIPADFGRKST
jgi:ribonuclease HI